MMHKLSDDRLELMSSYTSSDTSVPRVEVTGHREYDYGSYQPWGWTSVYEQGGTAPVFQETYHTTPFPAKTPANVNMEMLRDLVNSVTQEMASKAYFQTQEQGAFILRKADGSLQVGTIEVGTTNGVSPSIDVYPGDKIVAMIHTHTPQPNTFVGIPSSPGNHEAGGKGDTADMVDMMATGTVDPGALYYVIDTTVAVAYEYTWEGPEVRTIGSDITRDTAYY